MELPKVEKVGAGTEGKPVNPFRFVATLTENWTIEEIKEYPNGTRARLVEKDGKHWFYALIVPSLAEKLASIQSYNTITLELIWEKAYSKAVSCEVPMWVPYIIAIV